MSEIIFAIFAIVFFITRLVIFPYYIIPGWVVEAKDIFGVYPCYYLFSIGLFVLQALHAFWFYLIARMVYQLLFSDMKKDSRESDDEDDDDTKKTK